MKSLSLHSSGLLANGLLADSVNDASSTRKVYLLAGGLALLGLALLVITVWFWRSTRPEPELLAPLEIMGDRKFRRLDVNGQQDLLDSVRPDDAQPLRWGVVEGAPIQEPVIDLVAAARIDVIGFDDLRDPNPAPNVDGIDSNDDDLADVALVVDREVEVDAEDAAAAGELAEVDQPDDPDGPDDADDADEADDADDGADGADDADDADEADDVADVAADAFVIESEPVASAAPLASELMDPLLRNRRNRNR